VTKKSINNMAWSTEKPKEGASFSKMALITTARSASPSLAAEGEKKKAVEGRPTLRKIPKR